MVIQDILRSSALKYGEKVFVTSGSESLSYIQLEQYSSKLAIKLSEHGIGQAMGVISKNSIEYLIAYFGIIKSGNIVVALNSQSAPPELKRSIDDLEMKVIFGDGSILNNLWQAAPDISDETSFYILKEEQKIQENSRLDYLSLSDLWQKEESPEIPAEQLPSAKKDDIAQIIFTSGTKGIPNGVCLTHDNLITNMEQITDRIDIQPDDNMLVILPFYYSYGNSLILSHMSKGAKLTLNNHSQLPVFLLNDLIKEQCTSLAGVTSNFIMLMKRTKFKTLELPHLRYVTFAGEPVAEWIITAMRQKNVGVYVMYGQTEATARIAILTPGELDAKCGSVGRPVKGIEAKVVDTEGNTVSNGELGEIVISGPNVMKGYWGAADTTKEKIRRDHLHTGDMGMLDEEGYLYVLSRMDDIIKVGGERISPMEIENILLGHDKVAEAAVLGLKINSDEESLSDYIGKTIYAFVIPSEEDLSETDIIIHCKQHLSRHKIPREVFIVSQLPKTSNGKLRRHLLKELLV